MVVGGADALLFDLGRVVIDLDFDRALACWATHAGCAPELLKGRFSPDIHYQRHERGEIDGEAYFAGLCSAFGMQLSHAQMLDGWNAIFVGEMPGMAELLAHAARRMPLYAFTNSNREHERYWSVQFADILRHFTEIYVSSTIGRRKPEAEAFDYVVRAIGVPAGRIVFFDDNIENIAGARACGLQAIHVGSTADVANVLAAILP
jgi:putative hydrolase of the HAD superfamily